MEPDTDTDSNISDPDEDEEYNTLVNNYSQAEVSEFLCEANFQAEHRWRKFTGRPTRCRRVNNRRRP
eukprot:12927221-Prorocentrum_lima.AAC.1